MASTFTDLGIEKMATGENAGTWGDKTNTNLEIVEKAIAGYVEQAVTSGGTTALSITDGDATESTSVASHAVIKLTGTITGNSIVTVPDSIEKVYIVTNGTSGAYTVQFKTASGTGVTFGVSEKTTKLFYSDGTNIVDAGFSGGTDLDGKELILDADADTSITADTDDQIDIKIAGADDFRFTANTFTALSGSGVVIPDGGLTLGSTAVSSTAAELNLVDGITAGTISASLAVIVDSNKDISGFRNVTLTGELDAATGDFSGDVDIDGTLEADAITINGTAIGSVYAALSGATFTGNIEIDVASGDPAIILDTQGADKYYIGVDDSDSDKFLIKTGRTVGSGSGFSVDSSGNLAGTGNLSVGNELYLASDDSLISMGANFEVAIYHDHNNGFIFRNELTTDDTPIVLTLQNKEADIAANDKIGVINFQAHAESTGTDAILVAAGIEAVSEGDFSSSNNATKLSFKTAASEAAAEKMSLSSAGLLTVADDIVFKDGGTIGVSSAVDAMTVSSGGIVTFKDDILIKDGGTIGSASDADAITIASNGQLTLTQTLIGTALDISGDIDIDGTTNLDVVDIDGALTQDGGAVFNEAGVDVDFRVESNTNTHAIFVEGSSSHIGINTSSPQSDLHVTGSDTSTSVIIENTNADASAAPDLFLFRNSSSPADDDSLGNIEFRGKNDNTEDTRYVINNAKALDVTDGTEDGQIEWQLLNAGSFQKILTMNPTEVVINEDSASTDFRVESNGNDALLFVDGANDHISIGGNSDAGGLLNVFGKVIFKASDNSDNLELLTTDADANSGPNLRMYRNSSSPADSDLIGNIQFEGRNDNSQDVVYGEISARANDVSDGTEDGLIFIKAMTAGALTEYMRFDPGSGGIVINDDSADLDFRVESNGQANAFKIDAGNDTASFAVPVDIDAGVTIDNITIDGTEIDLSSGDLTVDVAGDITLDAGGGDIRFDAGGSEYGKINLSGNNVNLHSTINNADIVFKGEDNSSTITALTLDMSAAGAATFNNDVTAFSDKRLKDNVETIPNALDKVCAMRGVTFTRNDNDNKPGTGVIAQEMQEVFPVVVKENNDELNTLSVSYGNLVGVLIEAIKELKNKVEKLEEEK